MSVTGSVGDGATFPSPCGEVAAFSPWSDAAGREEGEAAAAAAAVPSSAAVKASSNLLLNYFEERTRQRERRNAECGTSADN